MHLLQYIHIHIIDTTISRRGIRHIITSQKTLSSSYLATFMCSLSWFSSVRWSLTGTWSHWSATATVFRPSPLQLCIWTLEVRTHTPLPARIRLYLVGAGDRISVYLVAHICVKTTYVLCHVTASLYSGIFLVFSLSLRTSWQSAQRVQSCTLPKLWFVTFYVSCLNKW